MQDSSDKQPIIITLGGLLGLLVAALAGAEALPYRPVWQGLLLLGALILTTGLGRAWERHRLRGQATLSQDERLLSESQMIAGIQNWIADLETGTITIGPGNHPILGWPAGTYPFESIVRLAHPDDQPHIQAALDAITQEHLVDIEYRLIIDNEVYWEHTTARIAAGRTGNVLGISQDVTRRKQAEQMIAAQRDLARIISTVTRSDEAMPLCLTVAITIAGMDSGGIYLLSSKRQALELVYHQGLGEDFIRSATSYPIDAPNVRIVQAGTASYFSVEMIAQMPTPWDEGLRSIGVIPIHYQGRVLGCINVASHSLPQIGSFARTALETIGAEIGNIIIYLRTEESLRKNKQILHEAQAIANLGSWTADLQAGTFDDTPESAQLMGWIPGIHTTEDLMKIIHPDDRAFMQSAWAAALDGAPYDIEHRIMHDGKVRWLHVKSKFGFDEQGKAASAIGIIQDITERKQAEAALRERERQMQALVTSLDDIVLEIDEAGVCLNVWTAREELLVSPRNQIIGVKLHEIPGLEFLTAHVLSLPEVLASGQVEIIEYPLRLDGQEHWFTSHISPILVDKSDHRSVSVLIRDITHRKQAEEQLRELNQTLEERVRQRTAEVQDLYENAPIGYHSLDPNGNILMINQTELGWLGYAREELLGRPLADLLTPASQAIFLKEFPRFKQQGWIRNLEVEMLRKDGSSIPSLISATAIYDAEGNYLNSRSTVFDNTDRKKAEIALRESEAQNRLLFEESPDAVVLFDEAGRIVQINRAFTDLCGYPDDQLIGKTLDMPGLLSRETLEQIQASLLYALQTTSNLAAIEFRLRQANGDSRDVGARVFKLEIRSCSHYLATMRDITTQKQAEETLRQANAELAHAARAKDEFLANMSHELRTPLNAILGLSEALLEQVRGPLSPRQQESLRNIEASGQHLLALINDILDLSKVEAGRLELQIEPVMVAEVCHASMLFIKEQSSRKLLQLAFRLNNQLAEITADPRRLKQMLVNLLSNAVKFTPAGGQVDLEVDADEAAGTVRFMVRDSGIGIAPHDLAWLFQPFKQLDSSLSRQHEGTGLGLALVRRLAELHGGSVAVESALGKGSCFTISLPYEQPLAAATEPDPLYLHANMERQTPKKPAEAFADASSSVRILLVEDNEVNIVAISDYLQARGYELVIARNGQEALRRAGEQSIDLILMDIQMPEMDGLEATRRLRDIPAYAAVPIIALTALAMPGDRERCLAAGANEYLTKPVSLRGLADLIERMRPRRPDIYGQ